MTAICIIYYLVYHIANQNYQIKSIKSLLAESNNGTVLTPLYKF